MPIFTAIAAGAAAVATAVGFSAAAAGVVGAVAAFAARTLLTIGVSKLISNRSNKNASGTSNAGSRIQLPPATNNKLPVVYGNAYIGGIVTDAMLSEDQQTMWYVLTLAEKTDTGTYSFGDIYIDGKLATFDGTDQTKIVSLTTNSDPVQVDTKVSGYMYMYKYTNGSSSGQNTGQTAIQVLQDSAIPVDARWTSTDTMTNAAFVIVKVIYNQDAGTTSLPGQITFELTNSMNAPGAVLYDYMTNTRYGCGIDPNFVDTGSLSDLTAYSAEQIEYTPVGGGTAYTSRYTINGPVNTGENCLNNLQQLVDTCDSWLQYSELTGQWRVVINQSYTDYATLEDLFLVDSSILIGGIDVNPIDLNATYNSVECQYPNTNINDQYDYQVFDLVDYYPELLSPNEAPNQLVIQYAQVNNYVQAAYLGLRRMLQSREDLVINFTTDYSGIQVEAGDVIRVSLEEYGWDEKLFRVSQVAEAKIEDGSLGARITAFEYNDTVYEDQLIEDFVPAANTGLKDPTVIGTPTAPTITNVITSASTPSFDLNTTVPAEGIVNAMEFWYDYALANATPNSYANFKFYDTQYYSTGPVFPANATVTTTVTSLPSTDSGYAYYFAARAAGSVTKSSFSPISSSQVWNPSVTATVTGQNFQPSFQPNPISVPLFGNGDPDFSNVAINLYGLSGASQVDYEPNIANLANNQWSIDNANILQTGISNIAGPNLATGTGGDYATFNPTGAVMTANVATLTVPIVYKDTTGNTFNSPPAIVNINKQGTGANGQRGIVTLAYVPLANTYDPAAANDAVLTAAFDTTTGYSVPITGDGAVFYNNYGGNAVSSSRRYNSGNISPQWTYVTLEVPGTVITNSSISTNQIKASTITTNLLDANAVTADKINAGAITTDKLSANSITAGKIQANAITAGKIAVNAVTTNTLDANSVTADKISAGAITTDKLAANVITADKILANAVTANAIRANAVYSDSIQANAITAGKIAAGAVTANSIAAFSITTNKLDANSVTADKIAANSIYTDALQADSITAGKIQANAITSIKIDALAITSDKIQALAITTSKLDATAVTAEKLAANAVYANAIQANAITAGKIAVNAVTANTIDANAITADKIDVDAVTADKIQAGAITAAKISANAVTANAIAANSIYANAIQANAVTANAILASAITTTKLAADSVTSDKIQALAITTGKIAAGAVTATILAANSVFANALQANAVTAGKVAANAINANAISANAVTADKIIADAITSDKIQANAITGAKIAGNTITGNNIAGNTITGAKIQGNTITGNLIVANAITANLLDANSVIADKIAADAVTAIKIQANAVTAAKIAANAVTANAIAANSIYANALQANAVTANAVAANAITATAINADAITSAKIQANAVTAAKIAADSVSSNQLTANAVTAGKIAANAVTSITIAANAVTAGSIAANAVTAGTIAANAVDANAIIAGSITTTKLAANAITSTTIAANAITTDKLAANIVFPGNVISQNAEIGNLNSDGYWFNYANGYGYFSGGLTVNGLISAGALLANVVTTQQIVTGAVTSTKSNDFGATTQILPWTNVANAWPSNTRSIAPSGGVTIIPTTDPTTGGNTDYQEGSRIQVTVTAKIFTEDTANAPYNCIEIWKSGSFTQYDKGFNVVSHTYDVMGNAGYTTPVVGTTIHAYGFGALDWYSSDGGNTWQAASNDSTNKTILGGIDVLAGYWTSNTTYTSSEYTAAVGPLQVGDSGTDYDNIARRTSGSDFPGTVYPLNFDYNLNNSNESSIYGICASPYSGGYGLYDQTTGLATGSLICGQAGEIFSKKITRSSNDSTFQYDQGELYTTMTQEYTGDTLKDLYDIWAGPTTNTSPYNYVAFSCGQTGTLLGSNRSFAGSGFGWSPVALYIRDFVNNVNTTQPLLADLYSVTCDYNSTSTGRWVVVGQYGVIYASTNNGDTWTQRQSPVTTNLNDVTYDYFAAKFIAVGDNGVILESSDTITWTQVQSGITDRNLNSIDFHPAWGTVNIVGTQVIIHRPYGAGIYTVKSEPAPAEVYPLTRMTFFGSYANSMQTSPEPSAAQQLINGQVFNTTIIDQDYTVGQETSYYLVVGNMRGARIYGGPLYIQVTEVKK